MSTCYYGTDQCDDELWECETCRESFCMLHFHKTDKGYCVECVACEQERITAQNEEDETEHPYFSADLPNPFILGAWIWFDTFETMDEAVDALNDAGWPVDDKGRLALVSFCEP